MALRYKRVMLKLSGEVLEGKNPSGIDFKVLHDLCAEIIDFKKLGCEVAIVIGGGNIWRYRDFKETGINRVTSDHIGIMATIMNALAMQAAYRAGAEEALMCNYRGELTECSQANFFLVRGGAALTPKSASIRVAVAKPLPVLSPT